jgi:hypothetical protein
MDTQQTNVLEEFEYNQAIDLREMDKLIREYVEKREAHDKAKKAASDAYKEMDEVAAKIQGRLKYAGKKSYKVDGVGTFGVSKQYVVSFPSELADRQAFIKWLFKEHGNEVGYSKVSVNHQTLNSMYNSESEAHNLAQEHLPPEDRVPFSVPGISEPTLREKVSFRKDSK